MYSHMMVGSDDLEKAKAFYDATFQALGGKAGITDPKGRLIYLHNGGVFMIDDFGRQRQSPQALINRLIVPLESGTDHLVLESGRKIEMPFDTLVIFATNFEPRSLMDEAGLRRLRGVLADAGSPHHRAQPSLGGLRRDLRAVHGFPGL